MCKFEFNGESLYIISIMIFNAHDISASTFKDSSCYLYISHNIYLIVGIFLIQKIFNEFL